MKLMVKIDLKDRKILYQLDIDSRQSFRLIGKKIGEVKPDILRNDWYTETRSNK